MHSSLVSQPGDVLLCSHSISTALPGVTPGHHRELLLLWNLKLYCVSQSLTPEPYLQFSQASPLLTVLFNFMETSSNLSPFFFPQSFSIFCKQPNFVPSTLLEEAAEHYGGNNTMDRLAEPHIYDLPAPLPLSSSWRSFMCLPSALVSSASHGSSAFSTVFSPPSMSPLTSSLCR